MSLEHFTDVPTRASGKLISQYVDKVKIRAMIEEVFGPEAQEVEDALFAIWEQNTLDNAIGAQLERIAKKVGVPNSGVPDDDKRILIKARIRVNRSRGTVNDVRSVFEALTEDPTAVEWINRFDAGFTLRVSDPDLVVTNFLPNSEKFSASTFWANSGSLTVTDNAGDAPNGTKTAALLKQAGGVPPNWLLAQTFAADPGWFNFSLYAWIVPVGGITPPASLDIGIDIWDIFTSQSLVTGAPTGPFFTLTQTPTRFSVVNTLRTLNLSSVALRIRPFINNANHPANQIALWGAQLSKGSPLRRYVQNTNVGAVMVGAARTSPDPALFATFLRDARGGGIRGQLEWANETPDNAFTLDGASGQRLDQGRLATVRE